MPKTRLKFWLPKLEKNVERDKRVEKELQASGWNTLIIWECQLKNREKVRDRVKRFLEEK
jgi:DNA mismatch endonuclease (patch repair protein)